MDTDFTLTITSIIALCALISPLITTYLNNQHQLKLKKLESKLEHNKNLLSYSRNIYEKYVIAVNKVIHSKGANGISEYNEICHLALIYSPRYVHTDFKNLDNQLKSNDWNKASISLDEISVRLHNLITSNTFF